MLFAKFFGALPLILIPYLASAAVVNRTIDDGAGDSATGLKPVYFPSPSSIRMWKNETCPANDCVTRPDISRTFGNTYTAATFRSYQSNKMSITLRFTGTAIYTFFILINYAGRSGIISRTDCSFVLDNGPAVPFKHIPDRTMDDILYNQLVFSQTGLANTQHTLEIITEGLSYQTYVNFDYAIYTFDDGVETTSSPSRVTTSVAGTGTTIQVPDARTQTVTSQSVSTTTAALERLGGSDPAKTATMFLPDPEPSDPVSDYFDGTGTSASAQMASSSSALRGAGPGLLMILLPAIFLVN